MRLLTALAAGYLVAIVGFWGLQMTIAERGLGAVADSAWSGVLQGVSAVLAAALAGVVVARLEPGIPRIAAGILGLTLAACTAITTGVGQPVSAAMAGPGLGPPGVSRFARLLVWAFLLPAGSAAGAWFYVRLRDGRPAPPGPATRGGGDD